MFQVVGSTLSTAQILSPFPESPDVVYAALPVDSDRSMTESDIADMRKAVAGLPRSWFNVTIRHRYDHITRTRWVYVHLGQGNGPLFVGNFIVIIDDGAYSVFIETELGEALHWRRVASAESAIAVIWENLRTEMCKVGLGIIIS